jgi:hypothetical protein
MRRRLLAPASAVLALVALADVARADVASLRAELGAALGAMAANAARLRRALHEARLHGDRERVACASDGLSRADVALRTARESARAAEDALARRRGRSARRSCGRARCARVESGGDRVGGRVFRLRCTGAAGGDNGPVARPGAAEGRALTER